MTLEQRGIVRLRHRDRERLAGDDLRRDVADPTELQWWHNRSVHDGFGLVSGMETGFIPAGSEVLVQVASGLAYDAYGRPLAIRRRMSVEIPAQPRRRSRRSSAVLLLRAPAEDPWAVPKPGSAARSDRGPELCWVDGLGVSIRDGVPLACLTAVELAALPALSGPLPDRLAYSAATKALLGLGRLSETDRDSALALSSDSAYGNAVEDLYAASQACIWPRRARRIARSRLVTGMTIPQDTAWQPWTIPTPSWAPSWLPEWTRLADVPIGFQVRVDTSAYGFTETPRYFAWLQGPLFANTLPVPAWGVHWDHVDDAGPHGFSFYMSLLTTQAVVGFRASRDLKDRPLAGVVGDLLQLLRTEPFQLTWLAVTTAELGDCTPTEDPPDPCAERPDPCADEVFHGHVK
jgi:hypothetical protein